MDPQRRSGPCSRRDGIASKRLDAGAVAAYRTGVEPEEFEDVCFGKALVLRPKAEGKNPVYYVLGETEAGRQLLCVVISFPDGKGYPVTARDMTESEKRRYSRWKKP